MPVTTLPENPADYDTLIEQFDRDIGLFENLLVVGQIQGDGRSQVITVTDGVTAGPEIQRIQHLGTSGTFTLRFDGQTTTALAWNATALQVENALNALSSIGSGVHVVLLDSDPMTWQVTFLGTPADKPIIEGDNANLCIRTTECGTEDTEVIVAVINEAVLNEDAIAEVQRIQHSGSGGWMTLYFDANPSQRVQVAYNATADAFDTALETLSLIGHVTVRRVSTLPYSWEITFTDNNGQGVAMPQLRVDDGNLTPGGTIGNSATSDELAQTFHEDDPSMRLPDTGDRYASGGTAATRAIVEQIKGIFEEARITGGEGRNILVVGDADGRISVDAVQYNVDPFSGRVTLDNQGNAETNDLGFLNELYIVNLVATGGARVADPRHRRRAPASTRSSSTAPPRPTRSRSTRSAPARRAPAPSRSATSPTRAATSSPSAASSSSRSTLSAATTGAVERHRGDHAGDLGAGDDTSSSAPCR